MSKSSKVKGAAFEREIAKTLGDVLKVKVERNLEQVRSGGSDLRVGNWNIECKRRARISIYEWIEQAQRACKDGEKFSVVFRADKKAAYAIIPLYELMALIALYDAWKLDCSKPLLDVQHGPDSLRSPIEGQAKPA